LGPVSAKIAIDAPRERVFDIISDLSARPAWFDHFAEGFHLLRIEPVGVGAGARYKTRETGWMDSVIEDAERPHRIVERGKGGYLNRVPNVTEWLLSDFGTEGCEVQVTFWTEPQNALDKLRDARASGRRFAKGLRRALQRLREVVESDEPPDRIAVAGADRLGI
jgi:uncharacterized protein YndB with AHSA1/START domain